MKTRMLDGLASTTTQLLLVAASLTLFATVAQAQGGGVAASVDRPAPLTEVDVTLRGSAPTGPHAVVIEHDPGLVTHTIYRPRELAASRHPVVVWGEGGCAANGLMFPDFLSELASHGVVIIADGPPVAAGAPGGGGAGPQGGGAPPAGAAPAAGGQPGPGPGGAGRVRIVPDGTRLVAAMDWIEREASNPDSRFHNRVDVARIAAMGMSCGGLMAYGAAADPRVATVGVWNSGLLEPDPAIYDSLRGRSVILVTGGESDVAYPNSKRDFESIDESVPVFYGVYPSVGHGGTYYQNNGGAYGVAALAWLKWQLQGETGPAGRGFFVGDACGICRDDNWVIESRSLR